MDVILTQEQVFQLLPKFDLQSAKHKVEDKRLTLVAGTIGALLSRPKPEEIVLTHTQHRLEPFWHVTARVRTVFDRNWSFTLPVRDADTKTITTLGQDIPVAAVGGGHGFTLAGTEHCEKLQTITLTCDRNGNPKADLSKLLDNQKEAVLDLLTFAPEGVMVLPPEAPEISIIGKVLREVIQPERATAILEQVMEIETVSLYFRPVYAFEFNWARKEKDVVIEFDALSGETETGKLEPGPTGVPIHWEAAFDVSPEALRVAMGTLGIAIPGGPAAVNIVRKPLEVVSR